MFCVSNNICTIFSQQPTGGGVLLIHQSYHYLDNNTPSLIFSSYCLAAQNMFLYFSHIACTFNRELMSLKQKFDFSKNFNLFHILTQSNLDFRLLVHSCTYFIAYYVNTSSTAKNEIGTDSNNWPITLRFNWHTPKSYTT